jgi:hypothetical protein
MSFYLVHGGTQLLKLNPDGTSSALTLPTGVTMSATRKSRMAILGRNVVVVNGPSINLAVDALGNVRPMALKPPAAPPILAATGTGVLNGTYLSKYTFGIKDEYGTLISESDFSPASLTSASLVNKILHASNVQKSSQTQVNVRRLYRTASGADGTAYFPWVDIEGNVVTDVYDGLADAGLESIAARTDLGAPPGTGNDAYIEFVVEWKGRLWAKGSRDIDNLLFSGDGVYYGWPAINQIQVKPVGGDSYGITGLIRRRDELAVGRRNMLWKVQGQDENDFRLVLLVEGTGPVSHDTIKVHRDIGRFLAEDGVYQWGPSGVESIVDEDVAPWFNTDDFFNRSQFPNAFAAIDPVALTYNLFLASAGQTTIDRWVSLDLRTKKWLGPHKTAAFTPSDSGEIRDTNDVLLPIIAGTDGFFYKSTPAVYTDLASAIDFDIIGKFHSGDEPDIDHVWRRPTVYTVPESAGTLDIIPIVGLLSSAEQSTISHDLTKEKRVHRRLGEGRLARMRFRNNQNNQGTAILGYEIPFNSLGRRNR